PLIPYRGAGTRFDRQSVPAVAAGLSGPRNGIETPDLTTRREIQTNDEAASLGACGRYSLDQLVADDQRRAAQIELAPLLRRRPDVDRIVPEQFASLGVEGDHMQIGGRDVEFVPVQSQAHLLGRPTFRDIDVA